jgi:uncharacterized protein (TIGR02246 family)
MRHEILAIISVLIAATGIAITDESVARHGAEASAASAAASAASAAAVGFVDDWNAHDMRRFAELFTEDADFVNVIGLWWHGRSEIQKAHEALHATRMKDSHLAATDTAVRVLGPNAAVILVRWELTGDTGIDGVTLPTRHGILSLVTVSAGGKWLIASAQNTDVVPLPNIPSSK